MATSLPTEILPSPPFFWLQRMVDVRLCGGRSVGRRRRSRIRRQRCSDCASPYSPVGGLSQTLRETPSSPGTPVSGRVVCHGDLITGLVPCLTQFQICETDPTFQPPSTVTWRPQSRLPRPPGRTGYLFSTRGQIQLLISWDRTQRGIANDHATPVSRDASHRSQVLGPSAPVGIDSHAVGTG